MTSASLQPLVERLNALCEPMPYHIGWYVKDLRSGVEADRYGHVPVPSASTRKISILMTAIKQVHEGRFRLDQPVTMEAKYQNNTSGVFQHLQPGFTIQFRDALVLMIIVSDNTCTGTIADMVGLDNVQAFCDAIGMTGTRHRLGIPAAGNDRSPPLDKVNVTTPADVGLLLDLMQQGAADEHAAARLGATAELCRYALEIMTWQKFVTRIPYLLPEGTVVASKTGSLPGNYHDAGIVYQDGSPLYIFTVYSSGVPEALPDGSPGNAGSSLLMARMSRTIWDTLSHS